MADVKFRRFRGAFEAFMNSEPVRAEVDSYVQEVAARANQINNGGKRGRPRNAFDGSIRSGKTRVQGMVKIANPEDDETYVNSLRNNTLLKALKGG